MRGGPGQSAAWIADWPARCAGVQAARRSGSAHLVGLRHDYVIGLKHFLAPPSASASEPGANLAPRLDRREREPPLGPSSFQHLCGRRPEASHPRRSRRCLLKGCDRRFTPARPQARYCSDACRQAAQRWRRWQASRRYRASPQGQERRRAQQRRYRQRQRERRTAATDAAAAREGQRPAEAHEDFVECPCARPGCYEVFAVPPEGSCRRFCSASCRRELRRVLDREARYRQRRRRWRRQRLRLGVALPTPPEACLSLWEAGDGLLRVLPTPKRRKEREGVTWCLRPPFPFFERGKRRGYVDALA